MTTNVKKRNRNQTLVFALLRVATVIVIGILFSLLAFLVWKGIRVISWEFLTDIPRNGMTKGGILPAIVGTICLTIFSILIAFPIGLLSAIYLVEYSKSGRLLKFIDMMTNTLAGIPSIIFGLFGLAVFVNFFGFGDSLIAGSLTLAVLVLPIMIRTSEEALASVPNELKLASIGMGATRLQTIFHICLPFAFPRIITGLILAMGRVSGETAPILFTVAAYYMPHLPTSMFDQVMALPYHLYVLTTSGVNISESRPMAFGTALVLLMLVFILNSLAVVLRNYYQKKHKYK
jgi:phosphate transport system permease protein